jgi:hypothetical protein
VRWKNIKRHLLPVNYHYQKAGWMDRMIFKDWFLQNFVPEVQSFLEKNDMPPKALFLLNNAPSHPSMSILTSEDGNIFVLYLPPNVTSIVQPMNQGVMETMKSLYKKKKKKMTLNLFELDHDLSTFWKYLSIKDAIYEVAHVMV